MNEESIFLTTAEVSKLLNINEKKVYALAQEGIIPGTKITGKWLFPRKELVEYLKYHSLQNIKKDGIFNLLKNKIILGAGSDDPILSNFFLNIFNSTNIKIFYSINGSKNGIELLKNRIVHFALSHIYDSSSNQYNISYLKKIFPVEDFLIVNFFKRELGIVYNDDIKNFKNLDKEYTFVARQKGSGVRDFTEYLFHKNYFDKTKIKFYPVEIATHFEVAMLVKKNKRFLGVATRFSAEMFGLKFKKIIDERFDLITLQKYFFDKNFQKFFQKIGKVSEQLLKNIKGYDFSESGAIIN